MSDVSRLTTNHPSSQTVVVYSVSRKHSGFGNKSNEMKSTSRTGNDMVSWPIRDDVSYDYEVIDRSIHQSVEIVKAYAMYAYTVVGTQSHISLRFSGW